MTDIEKGDQIKDNDKRMPNRVLHVVGFEMEPGDPWRTRIICEDRSFRKPKVFRIRSDRVFSDGRARSYGFNKIAAPSPSP